MERRRLGRSGIEVTPLCLGGNVFGWTADQDASLAVLDAYAEAGGNFVDTANVYSAWAPGNRGGESETIVGSWLAARGGTHGMVVATKVGMAGGPDQPKGLARDHVLRGAEASLRRLGVDRIDLFYAHEDDPATPLEETLAAFGELVDQGLVRAIGASNIAPSRLEEALRISAERGLPRYEVLQPPYNLMDRESFEGAAQELCLREELGVAVYFGLARGFLTGKYRPGRPLPGSARAAGIVRQYLNDRGAAVLDALDEVAQAHDATPAQVALAWATTRPGVTAAIASATSAGQVRELAGSADLPLTPDELARLGGVGVPA
jgi:aryl-alcohol dehydrogenase (NADP+)